MQQIDKFKEWIKKLSVTELILMQHDLRKHKEDKEFLYAVLEEIKKRCVKK